MALTLSRSAQTLRPSVFATLAERMKQLPPDHLPLHIGDTFRKPPEEARLENITWQQDERLYKYSHPFGNADLLEALLEKVRVKNGLEAGLSCLQVSCGATGGLAAAASTLFDPGDEVMVLAPFWPLILGILRTAGAAPVQVPFSSHLWNQPDFDIVSLLTQHRTNKTRGLYFSNPNNPDGLVYSPQQLQQIADFAVANGLWVVSDEAYEDYLYEGNKHISIGSLPEMRERTVTVFTFSKSYAMAGLRLGYVVSPAEVSPALRRVNNHKIYNLSSAVQQSGLAAVRHGDQFLEESKALYQPARDALFEVCQEWAPRPDGGGYVFLRLDSEEAAWSLIHRALDQGLCLAPGEAFGEAYKDCIRVCFTSVPLEQVRRGAHLLAELLGPV